MIHTRLKECSAEPRLLCSMDPITLGLSALGGIGAGLLGGAAAGGGGGSKQSTAITPTPTPAEPKEQQQPGKKPRPQSSQPSFIGSAAVPGSANTGGKTLLGSM